MAQLIFAKRAIGQKVITLAHNYRIKTEKLYNMDGAEIYVLVNKDTVFLPKISKYEFVTSMEIDSLISWCTIKNITFLIKTPRSIFSINVPKNVWSQNDSLKFSFYKTPKYGSFSAFTFAPISSTAQITVTPNREWQPKFYPYEGR